MGQAALEEIIDLGTADLDELSPSELRHWVSHVVVHAMLGTAAGPRIDREKLSALVDTHFDDLLHGQRFDFAPVLAALLRIPGVTERDLYVGVVSLMGQLRSMNLDMEEPALGLTPHERAALIDEAYAETETARSEYQGARIRQAVKTFHTKKLGQLLVEDGLLDESQLQEGLEAQEELGGRLGSNLVRMGFISEEQLASFLGRQLGLPCITRLERVSPEAIRRLPRQLAVQYKVVPISVNRRELGVAMADPANLEAADAIAFKTGLRVRPAVAPELLIEYALARFYGERSPVRIRRLDVHRAKVGSADITPSAVSLNLDLLTADISEPWSEPEPTGDDIAGLATRLADVQSVSDALEQLGRFLSEHFATSAVFELDGTHARGFSAHGIPQGTPFTQVALDVHQHPMLSDVFVRRGLYLGAEPTGHEWMSATLGVPTESLFTVMPVLQHDRVHAILVANGRRKATDDPVADDQAVAQLGSMAMSMVALRKGLLSAAQRRQG